VTNVVLVVVDALRADGLGPRIGARTEDWFRYPGYVTSAPWTLPACTSLLTGTSAATHEHFSNRHELAHAPLTRLFGAERIKQAIVNNSVLTRSSGLAEGFDDYKYVKDLEEAFVAAHEFLDARERDRRPFFLLFHTNIPHDYYLPVSRKYYEHAFPERHDWFPLNYRVLSYPNMTPEQCATVRRIYDACTTVCDEKLDEVIARLPGDDTVVCFTADHGEGFDMPRARIHHGGRLHDDLLRVPFALFAPPSTGSAARAGLADAQSLRITAADVLPTLLALAGEPVPAGLDGDDIAALGHEQRARTVTALDRRYLYLGNRFRLNTNARGKNMSRRARLRNRVLRASVARRHEVRAFVDGRHKLIVTTFEARHPLLAHPGRVLLGRMHNGTPLIRRRDRDVVALELFDLEADPDETSNLLLDRPGLVHDLEPLLDGTHTEVRLAELVA
jgi:arylsulfatase A-like enzyme